MIGAKSKDPEGVSSAMLIQGVLPRMSGFLKLEAQMAASSKRIP
jgi:hypothetical protein